ncbi:EamA family transporter [Paraburkholderia hospita]|uniref:EamA family transporter n=1 Tax=Paraburkholderia hospita TaxID=169430 RepID=UPI000DEF1DA8|nr:EamA family transporter [Paraburkholderia hospita]AXF05434.1 hypothetical protein CUJ88_43590 [Paraburkholderia hospita]
MSCATFCYGVGFRMQGRFSVPRLGTPGTLMISYMCGVVVAVVAFARGRNASGAPLDWPRFLVQAVASVAALACLAAGTGGGNTAIVTVLSSLSGGVTALLARVIRKEQLSWIQVAGVVGSIDRKICNHAVAYRTHSHRVEQTAVTLRIQHSGIGDVPSSHDIDVAPDI